MKHYVLPEDAPEPMLVSEPGLIVRTACREMDYVDSNRQSSIEWTDLAELAQITCLECRVIAAIKTGQVAS